MMKAENIVRDKSYAFALRIVKAYKYLAEEKKEYVLSKQLLRCGTSVGANIEEAIGGQSPKDFFAKLNVSYKEARETMYWLRLLKDSDILNEKESDSVMNDCDELLKIIGTIIKTMKIKLKANS
ncbi:MAG: four helix bundle protein [Ferruginibacter sp.]